VATQGRAEELRGEGSGATDPGSAVRRLYEAFAAWDMEAVAGLLSDDAVFHVPGRTRATIAAGRRCSRFWSRPHA
jgi:hypothetical protein